MLKQLKQQGITILVSTPYMDEADLCERIALIQNGRIMSVDTPENVTRVYPVPLYAVKSADLYRLLNDLRNSDMAESSSAFGEFLHVPLRKDNGRTTSTEDNLRVWQKLATNKGNKGVEVNQIKQEI